MASYDKAVPPGGEGKVILKINTKGYQGAFSKVARVQTDDPANEQIQLTMKADVKVPIHLSSSFVYLMGGQDETATRELEIRAELDKPLTLEPVFFDLDKIVQYKMEEIEKGKTFKLTFSTTPETPASFNGVLKLKTNYPERPEIPIRIRGRVAGRQPAVAAPPVKISKRFVLLRGEAGNEISDSIDIEAAPDKPLTLTPANFSLEGKVAYRIEELEKGKKFRLHFTASSEAPERFGGFLLLKTNYAEMPQIVIQIRGMTTSKTEGLPPEGRQGPAKHLQGKE
ncbi:conserved hypothetical protein [uncultured Desulfatiglans sp.]|nr:conserved hypothetical protein [uncultured Desulfatiglans sp.]